MRTLKRNKQKNNSKSKRSNKRKTFNKKRTYSRRRNMKGGSLHDVETDIWGGNVSTYIMKSANMGELQEAVTWLNKNRRIGKCIKSESEWFDLTIKSELGLSKQKDDIITQIEYLCTN